MEKTNYTQSELKQAYRLVTDDLYHSLLTMKESQTLRWTKLGKFTKKIIRTRGGFHGGQNYIYYRINFSPFRSLKTALKQSLTNQYAVQ